ncbi:MAG: triphosphoribosyl-dephospho-CoA synthase, partial [Oscillospiraceae bacterium]
ILYESFLYPKPGLVTPLNDGSHKDMSIFTFIDRSLVISKYFNRFILLGLNSDINNLSKTFLSAKNLGKIVEKEMFKTTKNINTHKGIIFSISLNLVSIGICLQQNKKINIYNSSFYIKLLTKDILTHYDNLNINKNNLSKGDISFLKYKIKGARHQAFYGYPVVKKALKFLTINIDNKNNNFRTSFYKALIFIISINNDTNILNRGTIKNLLKVKQIANSILKDNFTNKYKIKKLHNYFLNKNLTAGGSADLLAVTIFYFLIENQTLKSD